MIEVVVGMAGAALVGWLIHRKQQQRSSAIASGQQAGVHCMLKFAERGSRWKAGRLLIGAGPLVWKPSFGRKETALPADLRQAELRSPSMREGMSINPASRIVECESSDGKISIAVMPPDLDHVIKALKGA
ncbi:hypothetical protein [Streptomyces showdoensis]|uniref:hypothetical protein n=1 Tax=Streptomyces showdoensis TaxID=68268 RepID=UPI00103E6982|nr:hypothetical protein [Streptomyces showdoensis]